MVLPPGNEIPGRRIQWTHQRVAGARAHRVWTGPADQPDYRLGELSHFGTKPQFAFNVLLVSDGIEMALYLFRTAGRSSPFQQVAFDIVGERRAIQVIREDILRPLAAEEIADIHLRVVDAIHVGIVVARNAQAVERGIRHWFQLGPLELARNLEISE